MYGSGRNHIGGANPAKAVVHTHLGRPDPHTNAVSEPVLELLWSSFHRPKSRFCERRAGCTSRPPLLPEWSPPLESRASRKNPGARSGGSPIPTGTLSPCPPLRGRVIHRSAYICMVNIQQTMKSG